MISPSRKRDRWIRFRIRTLLLAVAVAAILLASAPRVYDWYTSTPLPVTVSAFNASASKSFVGKHEPPLTADEIVLAIESQLPNLDASDEAKAIYSGILRTQRLPRGAALRLVEGRMAPTGKRYLEWRI